MNTISPATVLTKAADLIEQGWVQGTYYNEGCFCADGALQFASGTGYIDEDDELDSHSPWADGNYGTNYYTPQYEAYRAAYDAACRAAENSAFGMKSIIGFNDDFAASAEDVASLLRKAVELVDA